MLKKFLILASMICVLVSSLVVVSFADEVDDSVKYNYDRYVEYRFSNLSSSSISDISSAINGYSDEVFLVVKTGSDLQTLFAGDVLISSYEPDGDTDQYVYKLVDSKSNKNIVLIDFEYDKVSGAFVESYCYDYETESYSYDVESFILYYNGTLTFDTVNNDFLTVSSGLVEDPRSPSFLLTLLFTGFATAVGGLALGVKESLSNVIWVDPTATNKVLSPFVSFIFTIAGLSIAMTVFFLIFRLIRFGRQR